MAKQNKIKPVALVTGASSGMGKDVALRLVAAGYAVYGVGRRVDKMQELAALGGVVLAVDLNDESAIDAAIDRVRSDHARIDVLINCAGYGQYGAIEDVPLAEARRQMEVNLFGLARITQLCLPIMRAQGKGKILNVSSIGGKIYTPLGGWYHASKFALEGWSDVLRNEVRGFGIDVIVIEPGGIETEWSAIASAEAKRLSGHGPYAGLVEAFSNAGTKLGSAPSPTVISDLMLQAIRAKKPRPRYVGGQMARPLLFLRKCLPDRLFDRLIMASFR